MPFKQIDRRLRRLEDSSGIDIPDQVEEVFRHCAETGEFGLRDGRRVPLAVADEVMRRVSQEPPAEQHAFRKALQAHAPQL